MRRSTEESNYEDVGNQQPRASVVSTNLTKNIAYDQPSIVASMHKSSDNINIMEVVNTS